MSSMPIQYSLKPVRAIRAWPVFPHGDQEITDSQMLAFGRWMEWLRTVPARPRQVNRAFSRRAITSNGMGLRQVA
jgi:hypothetical protein